MSTEAIEKRIQQLIQSYQKGSKQVLNDFAEKGLEIPDQLDLNIVDDDIEEMLNKITDSINNKNNH